MREFPILKSQSLKEVFYMRRDQFIISALSFATLGSSSFMAIASEDISNLKTEIKKPEPINTPPRSWLYSLNSYLESSITIR